MNIFSPHGLFDLFQQLALSLDYLSTGAGDDGPGMTPKIAIKMQRCYHIYYKRRRRLRGHPFHTRQQCERADMKRAAHC